LDATQIPSTLTMILLLRRTNNESGITIEFLVEGICIGHDPYNDLSLAEDERITIEFLAEGICIGHDPCTVDLYYDLSLAEDEQ
jgi:hypothetical protein